MSAGGAVVVLGAVAAARIARRAAQAAAQRRLRALQQEQMQLNSQLGTMAQAHGLAWERRARLAAPQSEEVEELDEAAEQTRREIARLRSEFTALTEERRDKAALARIRRIDAALQSAPDAGPTVRRKRASGVEEATATAATESAAGRAELRAPVPAVPPVEVTAAVPDAGVAKAETEVARKLSKIDADARVPESLLEKAAEVSRVPANRRPLLLANIDRDVRLLNETHRRRRAEAVLLGEVGLAATELNDGPLSQALAAARDDYEAERPVDRPKLSAALEAAQQRERAALADAEAKAAIVRQFERLGYNVVPGFDTAGAHGGVLLRHGDARHHAMLVKVDAGEADFEPVRLVGRGQPEGRPRRSLTEAAEDDKADKLLCAGSRKVVDGLAADGIEVKSRHHAEPGAVQPRRVAVATELLPSSGTEFVIAEQRLAEMELGK